MTPGEQADLLERFRLVRADPWYFCANAVKTIDQADEKAPIKPFPAHLQYLRLYARLWQISKRMAVPKSRRMFMSWMNIILYTWDAAFHVGRNIAFVSKKEEDADDLVKRAKFVLDNIDKSFIPKELIPKYEYVFGKLRFPELNSVIQGFPQGADQLRAFTFSGILADEAAFWEEAQKMYAASYPTLEGGGRMTMISSPAPGFFKNLVFDNLDMANQIADNAVLDDTDRFPMEGVEVWRNRKNKFVVFQLHYSANPAKKDPSYREDIKSAMPVAQYMQEYELQWDSFAGKPVYPDFDKRIHGSHEKIKPEMGLPLLRGWDFGLTPACIVAQLVEGQLRVIKEFTSENMSADRFSEMVIQQCRVIFPYWPDQREDWRDYIDPAGEFRKDTDAGTCAKILGAKGLRPVPGPVAWEARRQAVEHFLLRRDRKGPGILIDIAACPLLVRGFDGGYRYAERSFEVEPNKVRPIKDEHSHIHDALQYLCSRARMLERPRRPGIAGPSYSFTKEAEKEREGFLIG